MPGNAQKGNSHRSQGRCRVAQDQGHSALSPGPTTGLAPALSSTDQN